MRVDSTEEPSATISEVDETDPEAVRLAIRGRAEALKQRELRKAISQLEARGDLSPEQRHIITQIATAIVDEILAVPESTLNDVSADEEDTVRTAIRLFDPNQ
jgi:glutamyl-tRNA reductase